MDELAFTNIDANMAESPFHRVEENQIARFEFIGINGFCDFGLFVGPTWQQLAKRLFVQMTNESAAVKSCFFADAAITVWHTQ